MSLYCGSQRQIADCHPDILSQTVNVQDWAGRTVDRVQLSEVRSRTTHSLKLDPISLVDDFLRFHSTHRKTSPAA